MRTSPLLLCLALVGSALTAGCALVGDACESPVTGTATYVSSSTPPPYHYEWTVELGETSGSITYSPGYGSSEGWTEGFVPDAARVVGVCRELRDVGDSETAPGGGTLRMRWCGASDRAMELESADAGVADRVQTVVPAEAWERARGAYELWQQTQRR